MQHQILGLALAMLGLCGCMSSGNRWISRVPNSATPAVESLVESAQSPSSQKALAKTDQVSAAPSSLPRQGDALPASGAASVSAVHNAGKVRLASANVAALFESDLEEDVTTAQVSPIPAVDPVEVDATEVDPAGLPPSPENGVVELDEIINSVYRAYPLLEVAIYGRNIAAGEQLMAEGAYDLKLKAATENTPLGYYETYRQSVGLEQDLYFGGQVFGGYRVGRGEFEPWYLERQTNEGGEFRAGMSVPLAQNRAIDSKRSELWKATYGRNVVEPVIQAQVIQFVFAGSIAYWEWVAAGQSLRYADELYNLAVERDRQLRPQVEQGAQPESVLTDNQRLIISRQVKQIEAQRKLQQSAVKLSLFLRDASGAPYVPTDAQLPASFPEATPVSMDSVPSEIVEALSRRPELRELDFNRRIAEVDLAQSHNLTQPSLDATFWGAQDVGGFSSSKGDKQPLELQGSLNFSMPLQRRQAQGKIWSNEGKIAQLQAKRQFAAEKISTEVRNASIALVTSYQAIGQARESVRLNQEMQQYETVLLNNGASDLLRLNLREQQTFDSRLTEVIALLEYFVAQAELRAALGLDADANFEAASTPLDSQPAE